MRRSVNSLPITMGPSNPPIRNSTGGILQPLECTQSSKQSKEAAVQFVESPISDALQVLQSYVIKGNMLRLKTTITDKLYKDFIPELLLYSIKLNKTHFITYLLEEYPQEKKINKTELSHYKMALKTLLENRNPHAYAFFTKVFNEELQQELLQEIKCPPSKDTHIFHNFISEKTKHLKNPEFNYIQLLTKKERQSPELIDAFLQVIQSGDKELLNLLHSPKLFVLSFDASIKDNNTTHILALIATLKDYPIPDATLASLIERHTDWENPLREAAAESELSPISTRGFC